MNNDGRIDSPASATRSPKRPSGGDDIVGLLQHLTSQGTHLAQEQVKLVQAEVREGIDDLKAAIGAMLGAAVVGVAGFGVLLMALSFLLGDAIENLGLATLIVAVVALIVAAILYAGARKKMAAANLKPERSIRTMERTPAAATGNLTDTGATHG